jgi:hypothetical protein
MKTLFRLVLLALIVVRVSSCVQQWTQEEKENAEHFLKSLSLVIEAHANSNKGGPGVMSTQDFEKHISLYQRAFDEANLVRDDVLDKIHPELKNNYRMYFQKGAELRISAGTSSKNYDEIQGSALMDSWGDWFEKNRSNIKIPR